MSALPSHRRISTGRTHAEAWDALSYACALERPSRGWLWRLIFRRRK
jgi:hypothetical protein